MGRRQLEDRRHEAPNPLQAQRRRLDAAGEIFEHVAGFEDCELAVALYEAAVKRWPSERIMMRQEARIVHDSHRPRPVKE